MAAATLEQVLHTLRSRRDAARTFGIELVGVVGSLARGEAREDSDVDVIVQHIGPTTYFKLFDFEKELEAVIERPIDLVFSAVMTPVRRAYIERDLIPL